MASSCEHRNEPSGIIKVKEYLEKLSDVASQERLFIGIN